MLHFHHYAKYTKHMCNMNMDMASNNLKGFTMQKNISVYLGATCIFKLFF